MIVHRTNADIYYDLLMRLKKEFAKGGKIMARQKYTYSALVFALLRLSVFLNYSPIQ